MGPNLFALRRRRQRVLAAIVIAAGIGHTLTACVGDEPGTGANANDGGGGGDGSNPPGDASTDAASGPANAVTGDQTLYVGHAAVLLSDASTPSNGTFSWSITSVPAGSAIKTADLQNANTPQATFTPDVPGDYVVTLKVTASGGATSTATATVHAAPGKAFYVLAKQPPGSTSIEVHYVRTDGTGDVAITCPLMLTGSTGAFTAEGMSESSGVNWIEGEPGDDPRVAFGYQDVLPDGGTITYVATGMGSSRCDGLHLVGRVDAIAGGSLFPASLTLSPDGNRIAYMPSDGTDPAVLSTIGFDGNNKHNSFGPLAVTDAGVPRFISAIAAPRWIDNTHLAWIEDVGTQTWIVMTSADVVSPAPTVYMTCAATDQAFGGGTHQPSVIEFDILKDGNVLAAVQGAADASSSALSLVVLKPDATGQHNCQMVRQLTGGVDNAVDYALSPDKTEVAFLSSTTNTFDKSLFVVPVDGSSPPVPIAGAPDGGAVQGHGPHWSADGAWIVWGESAVALNSLGVTDAAVSTANVVGISAAGGKLSVMAMPDASTTSAYAVGNSCTLGSSRSSSDVVFAGLAAFLGLVVRRRRGRKSANSA
jgi:hypothetical protein